MLTELKLKDFIADVASNSPAPGGGSVAALSAASGAGLISMLANLTKDKKGYEEVHSEMAKIASHCTNEAQKFIAIIDEDTAAFGKFMDALKLPKETDEQKADRSKAMQEAAVGMTNVPLRLAKEAIKLMDMAEYVTKHGNSNALSDGAVAVLMLRSGVIGAIYNVRINLGSLKDQELVSKIAKEADELEARVKEREAQILSKVKL